MGLRPGCETVSWRGRSLSARCLSGPELEDQYLPLRYDILHREKKWTFSAVRGPGDLWDSYDGVSIAYGVFTGHELIAAARLILSHQLRGLPSTETIDERALRPLLAPMAEVSRVMVRKDHRRRGLFSILLLSGLMLARCVGVRTLLITERDDTRLARALARFGFTRAADGFSFADRKIAPNEPAATYTLDVDQELDRDTFSKIMVRRDALLQAADGLM